MNGRDEHEKPANRPRRIKTADLRKLVKRSHRSSPKAMRKLR